MIQDVVVDTNVFLHSNDPREERRADAIEFLAALKDSTTKLCVDEGFDATEAANRSHIFAEYFAHVRFGTLGYEVLAHLARSRRIKEVVRGVPTAVAKHIKQQGVKGTDRVFVQVTFNSDEKVLACHDFRDIPQSVRDRLRHLIGISVTSAAGALQALR